MKKKPQQPKQTVQIVAHYLIPTYNLYGNVARSHIIKSCYGDQEADVNVWLVKALPGDESRSVFASLVQERCICDIQKRLTTNKSYRAAYDTSINCLDDIIMMNRDPEYECGVGDSLREVTAKYLDELNVIYNLKCAKLVAGIAK